MSLEDMIRSKVPLESGPRVVGDRVIDGRVKGSLSIHLDVERTGDDEVDAEALRENAIRHLKYGLEELSGKKVRYED